MEIDVLDKMINDSAHLDLHKMQYQYSNAEVSELLAFMDSCLWTKLPLIDFNHNHEVFNLLWLPGIFEQQLRMLYQKNDSSVHFSMSAAEEEILSTFAIEHIDTSCESVRRILNGGTPHTEDEHRIHGI